ncbi:hypothetical protein C2E20_2665 [Micractinium conductrix]|uniref:MACPF domain-containing protein n=1 Tax=Micractinium conductrix TaxID=554055 RepID=A0A2P6VJI4_9CHLO|nr:hypothetical protein C2E20_2665 [Micractinium conductrix]|eukprot:PSC74266.1 hypothetical protein C2E20_2665 [Micractinium conductrix]
MPSPSLTTLAVLLGLMAAAAASSPPPHPPPRSPPRSPPSRGPPPLRSPPLSPVPARQAAAANVAGTAVAARAQLQVWRGTVQFAPRLAIPYRSVLVRSVLQRWGANATQHWAAARRSAGAAATVPLPLATVARVVAVKSRTGRLFGVRMSLRLTWATAQRGPAEQAWRERGSLLKALSQTLAVVRPPPPSPAPPMPPIPPPAYCRRGGDTSPLSRLARNGPSFAELGLAENRVWLGCPGSGVELVSAYPRCERLGSHLATCKGYWVGHEWQPYWPEDPRRQVVYTQLPCTFYDDIGEFSGFFDLVLPGFKWDPKAGLDGRPPPSPPSPPRYEWRAECILDPTKFQAYDDLIRGSSSGIFADLLFTLRELNLTAELRVASQGKILGAPTNRAMKKFYMARQIDSFEGRFNTNQTEMRRWYRQWLFEAITKKLSEIQPTEWEKLYTCPAKVIPVNDLFDVDASMVRIIPADYITAGQVQTFGVPKGARALSSTGVALTGARATAALRASGGFIPDFALEGLHNFNRYSVLGQGYNVFEGFPLSWGLASVDPGFTYQNIFSINDTTVSGLDPGTGGQCRSDFSSQLSYSTSAFSESSSTQIGVEADFDVASFSANANYNTAKEETNSRQMVTITSKAQTYITGWALRGAPMGIPLNKTFIANVAPLAINATSGDWTKIDEGLIYNLISSFGTHYVNKVYTGGLVSLLTTMTAESYAKLTTEGYRVSVSASVLGASGSATTGGSTSSAEATANTSSYFGKQIMPPEIIPPFLFGNFVDCGGWSRQLYRYRRLQNRDLPPVYYTLSSILNLFSFPDLWEGYAWATAPVLRTIRDALKNYIQGCSSYDGAECIAPSDTCVPGSYQVQTPGGPGCMSCFDTNVMVGPRCHPGGTDTCTQTTCTCKPIYTGPRCTVMIKPPSPPPPRPPPPPIAVPGPPPSGDCFPGDATAQVLGRGAVPMRQLRIGDHVLALDHASGRLGYRAVYLFGHQEATASGPYLNIEARAAQPVPGGRSHGGSSGGSGAPAARLQLSERHWLPVCAAGRDCGPPRLPGLPRLPRALRAVLLAEGSDRGARGSSSGSWQYLYAGDVQPGMQVLVAAPAGASGNGNGSAAAGGALQVAVVTLVWSSFERGLFNPFVYGGTILVDGVLASDQSEWLLDNLVPPAWRPHLPAVYEAILVLGRGAYRVLGPELAIAVDSSLCITAVGHKLGRLIGVVARGAVRVAGVPVGLLNNDS